MRCWLPFSFFQIFVIEEKFRILLICPCPTRFWFRLSKRKRDLNSPNWPRKVSGQISNPDFKSSIFLLFFPRSNFLNSYFEFDDFNVICWKLATKEGVFDLFSSFYLDLSTNNILSKSCFQSRLKFNFGVCFEFLNT